ncbi:MAG: hypothetical protein ACYSSI_00370 [Planctomycetota bacterium]|jgi:polyhydroxyalkanoate synthesis regulator phasin
MVKASKNKAEDVESIKKALSIKDRLMLLGLLPKEGNILAITLAKDIRDKVVLTQAEMTKYKVEEKISTDGTGRNISNLVWDEKGQTKKIEFTNAEWQLLKEQVEKLDNKKRVTPDLLSLCLMIKG